LFGCGNVRDEHIAGPYYVIATDVSYKTRISYRLPDGNTIGRIPAAVVAYGFDERYILAEVKSSSVSTRSMFYYIDRAKDSRFADPSTCVTGPLTTAELRSEASHRVTIVYSG
jgi:predicted Zn-dependent protease